MSFPTHPAEVVAEDEAVEAARLIRPKVAVPMHVGRGIGELEDAEKFGERASVPVEILMLEA